MGNCAELQLVQEAVAFDSADYRRALARFATGVAVITTADGEGRRAGVTVNSFTSVSLEPPLVLWCLGRHSSACAQFAGASHFAVNVLAREQSGLSRQFAAKNCDRFAGVDWHPGPHGSPLLSASLASFECAVAGCHEAGDHLIFLGRVLHYRRREGDPLVFHTGRYWHAGEEADALQAATA